MWDMGGRRPGADQVFVEFCYVQDKHPLQASLVLNGLCYVYPQATRAIPLAWRASKSHSDMAFASQGSPEGLETLACMENWLRQRSETSAHVAADMVPVAVDGYLREQDMVGLLAGDLVWAPGQQSVAAHFGQGERGERSKTGRGQGVIFKDPHVVAILSRRLEGLKPADRVFPMTFQRYGTWLRSAARGVCGADRQVGPPHSARHTGASRDLATGYRDFNQVERRGRCKADDSVQRYACPHVWLSVCSDQSVAILEQGRALLAQRASRPTVATG